jgi:hypothetical protein
MKGKGLGKGRGKERLGTSTWDAKPRFMALMNINSLTRINLFGK